MEDDGKLRVDSFKWAELSVMEDANGRLSLSEGFMEATERKTKNQGSMSNAELDILDRKALGSIRLCLAPSVQFIIIKAKMKEVLMQTLAKLYEKPSASNKVFLMKFLFNMKMVEVGYVANHLNEYNMATSKLF